MLDFPVASSTSNRHLPTETVMASEEQESEYNRTKRDNLSNIFFITVLP